jgi:phosphoglycolate phosphatase-like HAD superfamily hydrolase
LNERDYVPVCPVPAATRLAPGTAIEVVRERLLRQPPKHALFDFDGTLSLIREGWMEIMVLLLVERLLPVARPDETPASIEALVRDFVTELTGKQTIYQMIRLAEEIRLRGGTPLDPQDYKAEYHDRLMARIDSRRAGLADGSVPREAYLVAGSHELLSALRERGTAIYIASGTDEQYVLEEARLLGLDVYAPGRIYGAQADYRAFSKEMVIRRILAEHAVDGEALVAFGDGYVEIADCRAVGGLAVAVATDEAARSGTCDAWKRARLIGAGADLVVPDYREARKLVDYIWGLAVRSSADADGAASLPTAPSGRDGTPCRPQAAVSPPSPA